MRAFRQGRHIENGDVGGLALVLDLHHIAGVAVVGCVVGDKQSATALPNVDM